ncbi:MAG: hypothetical protein WC538_16585 [Thermoanaerobaculia bacterium]
MKKKTFMSLGLAMALAVSFGCKRTEAVAETDTQPLKTTTAEIPGTASPNDLNPVTAQSYVDDFVMGHGLAPEGVVAADKKGDSFSPGQPIHLTMTVKDAPANAAVKVVWYGPAETKIRTEQKSVPVGATTLAFSSTETAKWAIGDYRAEVWIGDEKVDTESFKIVDLTNTGK